MPIARFYIKEKNRDGVCLIFLRFYCKPRQLTLSTGCHVRPADWNEKTQRVRKTDPNADSINAVIDGIAEDVTSAEKKLKAAKKAVTPEAVRAMVEKSPENRANADVAAFACTHFDDVKSKKVYDNLAGNIETFTRSTRRGRTFEELTPVWFSDFRKYMFGRSLSDIYVARMLKALKTVVKKAALYGYTSNTSILIAPLEVEATGASAVILTLEEIKAFALAPLKNASLAAVRDCFVCAALTGLRHSDWGKLTTDPAHVVTVQGRKFCRVVTQKTGVVVHVPLFDLTEKILIRHGGKLPVISDQKTNAYLKEAARLAGFTEATIKHSSKGKQQQTETFERCEMMGTHTARRTFNSAARAVGMPDNLIGEMTGHSKKKNMADLYDRRKFEAKAEQMEPYLQKMETPLYEGSPISFI